MNNSFYIKKITSYSINEVPSTIVFSKNLNIIHGPSNTGKSLIIKCIDYMFGSEKIDGLTDQKRVEMVIEHEDGFLTLLRNINEDARNITVKSSIPYIESKKYKAKGEDGISRVYLRLLGITSFPVKVIKKADYTSKNLTWKSISHMFLLEETEMIRKESILLPKYKTSVTSFLSSLIYLITGNDHSKLEEMESSENKKIRKQAVIDYINKKILSLTNYKKELREEMLKTDEKVVKAQLDQSLESLKINQSKLETITSNNELLIKENYALKSERESNSISIKNFSLLINQYEIDLKRLTLIVEGSNLINEHSSDTQCPFCNSHVKCSPDSLSPTNVIHEIQTIKSKISELNSTLKVLENRDKGIESRVSKNNELIASNIQHINESLRPRIKSLKETISQYNLYFNFKAEEDLINSLSTELNKDINTIEKETNGKSEFKPKDNFPRDFYSEMGNILYTILEGCSFPNLSTANLDKSTFDILVNGKSKEREGKGYRAYLNTVLALSMRDYLSKFGQYFIPVFITDTPLLGLDELKEPGINSMRVSLYNFLDGLSEKGQIIIADNNNNLPNINYTEKNINTIEFTKSKTHGRYGFLVGITD